MKKIITIFAVILSLLAIGCQKEPIEKDEVIVTPKNDNQTQSKSSASKLVFDKEAMEQDPFSDKNGPFYHKVYKAVSKDGLTFERTSGVILDKSSVPDAVKMPDGRIIIYTVDGAQRSYSGFMVAVSKDNGKTFEQGSLPLKNDRPLAGADPQAVLLPDGKVRLYYLVMPDKKPALDENGTPLPLDEPMKIMSAISDDGITFTEEKGIRYQGKELFTDPDVIKIGSKWFMYLSKGMENIAFSSTDGKTFKKEKSIRMNGAISKTVPIGGGKYRQFFTRNGINSAVTTDGLNFVDDSGSRLEANGPQIIADPTPVKVGNQWILFYKAAKPPTGGPPPQPPN